MNSNQPNPSRVLQKGHLIILMFLVTAALCGALCVYGVTGFFRLSSDATALQTSVMKSAGGQLEKKIAIHVGWFTTGLLRNALRWVHLEAEPRAAIEAVRGAEVGVYKLTHDLGSIARIALLADMDRVMSSRGWNRAVGVAKDQDFVAVYIPHKGISPARMKCQVIVLHEDTLVLASASANLKPVIEIVSNRLDHGMLDLALR